MAPSSKRCQRYSVGGVIDTGILASFSEVNIQDVIKNIKEKKFPEVRKWVVNNLDNDSTVLLRRIYDVTLFSLEGPSVNGKAYCYVVRKYQYQAHLLTIRKSISSRREAELMVECEYK